MNLSHSWKKYSPEHCELCGLTKIIAPPICEGARHSEILNRSLKYLGGAEVDPVPNNPKPKKAEPKEIPIEDDFLEF